MALKFSIPALLLPVLPAFALLAGCGANDSADGPGGVTADEARALNEAAAILDARAGNAVAAMADNVQDTARSD